MINFFRKIRQRLLKENRFRKYLFYAIGEIILVVIGILIALQINNWNESVKDDHRKKELLKAVHQEFVTNRDKLNAIVTEHEIDYICAEDLIKSFPIDIETVDLDILREAILDTFGEWTYEPLQSRINYLLSSSEFNLIKDEELKSLLLSWESIYEDFHQEEQKATDYNQDILFPYVNKYFPMVLDLKDPRYDKSLLQSFEFENMIIKRHMALETILYNGTEELNTLQQTIERIIVITEPYAN